MAKTMDLAEYVFRVYHQAGTASEDFRILEQLYGTEKLRELYAKHKTKIQPKEKKLSHVDFASQSDAD